MGQFFIPETAISESREHGTHSVLVSPFDPFLGNCFQAAVLEVSLFTSSAFLRLDLIPFFLTTAIILIIYTNKEQKRLTQSGYLLPSPELVGQLSDSKNKKGEAALLTCDFLGSH